MILFKKSEVVFIIALDKIKSRLPFTVLSLETKVYNELFRANIREYAKVDGFR